MKKDRVAPDPAGASGVPPQPQPTHFATLVFRLEAIPIPETIPEVPPDSSRASSVGPKLAKGPQNAPPLSPGRGYFSYFLPRCMPLPPPSPVQTVKKPGGPVPAAPTAQSDFDLVFKVFLEFLRSFFSEPLDVSLWLPSLALLSPATESPCKPAKAVGKEGERPRTPTTPVPATPPRSCMKDGIFSRTHTYTHTVELNSLGERLGARISLDPLPLLFGQTAISWTLTPENAAVGDSLRCLFDPASVHIELRLNEPLLSPALQERFATIRFLDLLPPGADESSAARRHLRANTTHTGPGAVVWGPDGGDVRWNHRIILMAGRCDPAELVAWLDEHPLTIELHDRDRKGTLCPAIVYPLCPGPLGRSFWRFQDSPTVPQSGQPAERPTPILRTDEPFGLACIDLRDLCCGGLKTFTWKAPVIQGPLPSQPDEELARRLIFGIQPIIALSTADRAVPRLPAGPYVERATVLRARVQLVRPLDRHALQPGAYGRAVLCFRPPNANRQARCLLDHVYAHNMRALQLEGPLPATLANYQLPVEKRSDAALDVLTGVQVIDPVGAGDRSPSRIFVVEGLRAGAMGPLGPFLSGPDFESATVLYDPAAAFHHRLFLGLALDLERIRLRQPLATIEGSHHLAVHGHASSACVRGLRCLAQMTRVSRFRHITELHLWPQASELVAGPVKGESREKESHFWMAPPHSGSLLHEKIPKPSHTWAVKGDSLSSGKPSRQLKKRN
ncbi:hypothetical protein PAPYR_6768 [Paratrimastix pyriformis]|uniref:Uncharacterized protein n=1 Tax=Paratrimastix pyriformis TaxID=342808 RepID=A0ABQ8UJ51_9EUKA|nr:hypothetical protein PAPYR_6768 [Paratrimastix pyriformis]